MDEMNPHVYCLLTLQYSAVRLPHSSGSKCELFRLNLGRVVFTSLITANESVWFSIGRNSCATTDAFSQIPPLLFLSSLQKTLSD